MHLIIKIVYLFSFWKFNSDFLLWLLILSKRQKKYMCNNLKNGFNTVSTLNSAIHTVCLYIFMPPTTPTFIPRTLFSQLKDVTIKINVEQGEHIVPVNETMGTHTTLLCFQHLAFEYYFFFWLLSLDFTSWNYIILTSYIIIKQILSK